ncbi:hypothetical protein [Nitrospirillum amazonense]|uniref:hypothetical protein n=1 Tax=Nitrospirillum amazonense TaxID=28077 RepID=UPI00241286BF|nr:hypothetical protein [Nitrospirillum amazonense]MDG3444605.1 hypothetical protein [Nitrospirillum amazonense]
MTQLTAYRERLFCGVTSTGLIWADRSREKHGDYKRLAFMAFSTLELSFEKDCGAAFRQLIGEDAAPIQARRGEPFEVSTAGQTITLGHALP